MWRIVLLPFAVIFELLLVIVAWITVMISTDLSKKIVDWACDMLPDRRWYFGHTKSENDDE